MTEKLTDVAGHWCRRCEQRVQGGTRSKKPTGEVEFVVRCHGATAVHLASRSELEDARVIHHFEELPTADQQTLSDSAMLLFGITAALDELIDQRLVVFKQGALLPSLSKRGRDLRDHRNAERDRRMVDE